MTSAARARSVLAALCLVTASCGGDEAAGERDIPGLVHAVRPTRAAIDVAKASGDVAELIRAATLPHAIVGEHLGPHHLEVTSSSEVREGDAVVESVSDRAFIDLGKDGQFHAALDNSREYGREVWFVGGTLYLRPRFGKFHGRPPTDDGEPARLRDDILGALGAALELAGPGLGVRDGGEREVGGRPGRVVVLGRGAGPRPDKLAAHQAWRADAVIQDVGGELVLDAASGVVLSGKLTGQIAFQREGHAFVMSLAVEHAVSAIGTQPALAAPPADQIVADTSVPRELAEREELLEGIAPPATRARTPGNPTGAASAATEE